MLVARDIHCLARRVRLDQVVGTFNWGIIYREKGMVSRFMGGGCNAAINNL